jgi:membrane protease YdiL (CAAX protease family)
MNTDTSHRADHRSASRARPLVGPESIVGRHQLISFFVLSYVLAWGPVPFGTFVAFSPLIAAIIVIAVSDPRNGFRDLVSRMLRWRVSWQWYLAAVAFPVGIFVVSIIVNRGMGAPSPSLSQFSPWYAVLMVFATNMVNPLGAHLGEEAGWRAFALPRLNVGRTRFAATCILAVLVTVWHVPLMLSTWGLRPIELLSTVAVTFWYAWLFDHAGGSALMTLISHSVEGSLETSTLWSGADASRMITIWALVASAVVIGLLVGDRSFWWSSAPGDERHEPRPTVRW